MPLPPLPSGAHASLSQIYPLTTNKIPRDIESAYAWYRALRNIGTATNNSSPEPDWPRPNIPIKTGTITGLAVTGGHPILTDSGANFANPLRCGNVQAYSGCFLEILYKDDPRWIPRCGIVNNSSGTTLVLSSTPLVIGPLTVGSPSDWIARGQCTSLSDLIGSEYRVYATDDIGSYDRWKLAPNPIEYVGSPTLAASGLTGSAAIFPTASLIVSPNVSAGTFTLTINSSSGSSTTSSLPYNASASAIQTAVTAASSVGMSNAVVVQDASRFALAFDPSILPASVFVTPNVSGGTVTVGTYSAGTLLDPIQSWSANQWTTAQPSYPDNPTTFDVMLWDSGAHGDNLVRRFQPTGNASNNISLGSLSGWKPSLNLYYSILKRGGLWQPQAISSPRTAWYSGLLGSQFGLTHEPDDSIGTYPVASLTVSYDPGDTDNNTIECAGTQEFVAFDVDVWNDCCDPWCCSRGNKSFNPNLFQSDRSIQLSLMGYCGLPWIDSAWGGPANPSPQARPVPMTFPVAARAANASGSTISAFNTTIGSLSGDNSKAYIGISLPYPSPTLYYTAVNTSTGAFDVSGQAVLAQDGTGVYIPGTWSSYQVGETLICTWGFFNPFCYAFRYLNPKTVWLPSVDDSGSAVDPPQVTGGYCPVPYVNQTAVAQALPVPVSVSSITQSNGSGTVTTATPHYFTSGNVVTLSGADQAGYNGPFAVTIIDAFNFSISVDPATASPATGTITAVVVQSVNLVSTTLSIQSTVSCVVVFAGIAGAGDPGGGSITDSLNQTWNYLGYTSDGTDPGSVGCWYLATALPGNTTITFAPSAQTRLTLMAVEVVGGAGAMPVDTSAQSSSSGSTTPSTTALTTTAANDMLLCFGTYSQSSTPWTAGSGWTMVANSSNPAVAGYALESQLAATAGNYNTGFGIGTSQPNTCWAIALKRGTQTAYLGTWRKRPASTNYVRYDNGTGSPSESGPAFQANDIAEYIGDNAFDPTLPGYNPSDPGPFPPYVDHLYTGTNGASPTNPLFTGKTLNPSNGMYYSTNVDAQGTGTALMTGAVASYQNSGGSVAQISITPTVANNWLQNWYSTSGDMSITLTGTASNGSGATVLVDTSNTFTTQCWGCPCTVSHNNGSGIVTTVFTINGAGLVAHQLSIGAITGAQVYPGDTYSITVPNCVNYVHYMTAASGSGSTTFVGTGMANDVRFAQGIYDNGFTLKVFKAIGGGAQKLLKYFITATNKAAGSLTVQAIDGQSIASGDLAEIDWPKYELNKFDGLYLTVKQGNTSNTAMIAGNDQSTLHLNLSAGTFSLNSSAGATFTIQSYLPGSVLRRDPGNTKWIIPTGQDPRTDPTTGNKPNFPADPRNGQPMMFSWYGPIHIGTLSNPQTWNEMYAIAQTFKRQEQLPTWRSRADLSVPENNALSGIAMEGPTPDYWFPDATASGIASTYYFIPAGNPNSPASSLAAACAAMGLDFNAALDDYAAQGYPSPWPGPSFATPNFVGPSGIGFFVVNLNFNGLSEIDNTAPYKIATASFQDAWPPTENSGNNFEVGYLTGGAAGSLYAYAYLTSPSSVYASSADFWDFSTYNNSGFVVTPGTPSGPYTYESTVTTDNFNSSGDAVVYNLWKKWDTEAIATSPSPTISSKLGSLNVMNIPILQNDPGKPADNYLVSGGGSFGYNVTDVLCTVEYSLPFIS